MDYLELREKVAKLKTKKQSFLNDTYHWVQLARDAVSQLPDSKFTFEVPRSNEPTVMRTITRNNGPEVKRRIIHKDIFNSAFISAIAAMEDYLSKVMMWILQADNVRIKCTVSGVNFTKDVPIVDVIDQERDDIIARIIQQRIDGLFYAGPQKQWEYFDKALGIQIDPALWSKWTEMKARRDLWVHNGGIVNRVYLDKTGENACYSLGKEAIIDELYFRDCIATLKTVIGRINRDVRNTYTAE